MLEEQIEDYLAGLAQLPSCPSRSTFKHCVYGLRFYFRLIGLPKRSIALPSIKGSKKLPVVLNRSECKALFKAPHLLKHRMLLCLMYSAGLRVGEHRQATGAGWYDCRLRRTADGWRFEHVALTVRWVAGEPIEH